MACHHTIHPDEDVHLNISSIQSEDLTVQSCSTVYARRFCTFAKHQVGINTHTTIHVESTEQYAYLANHHMLAVVYSPAGTTNSDTRSGYHRTSYPWLSLYLGPGLKKKKTLHASDQYSSRFPLLYDQSLVCTCVPNPSLRFFLFPCCLASCACPSQADICVLAYRSVVSVWGRHML
jgi:hypothetical protein